MPGLFEVSRQVPLGDAIEDLLLMARCSLEGEWEGRVLYLPLRPGPGAGSQRSGRGRPEQTMSNNRKEG